MLVGNDAWDLFKAVKIYGRCSSTQASGKWAEEIIKEYEKLRPQLEDDIQAAALERRDSDVNKKETPHV